MLVTDESVEFELKISIVKFSKFTMTDFFPTSFLNYEKVVMTRLTCLQKF